MKLRRAIPNRRRSTGNTYYWYNIDGKVISDQLQAKLALMASGIMHQRTNGSLVVFKIENSHESPVSEPSDDRAIIESIFPVVQAHIGA